MKNPYTIIAFVLIAILSLIPPIDLFVQNPFNDKWFLLILICGFAGFFTLFINVNIFVKIIAIGSFIQCFFSAAPFVSFTSYISIILCCYFYFVCTKIENMDIVFKMLQTILFLNVFLMFMQGIGKDVLLNWDQASIEHFGIIGQHMQMASFSVILCSVLICFSALNFVFPFLIAIFCGSTWTILSASLGVAVYLISKNMKFGIIVLLLGILFFFGYAIKQHKFEQNFAYSGRFPEWVETVKMANQRPIWGWGPGTYKFIYPQVSTRIFKNMCFKNSHNFICQLLFEVGYPSTIFILFMLGFAVFKLICSKNFILLSGLLMILSDALVHFPERMVQCVLLIILFLSICERRISYGYNSV